MLMELYIKQVVLSVIVYVLCCIVLVNSLATIPGSHPLYSAVHHFETLHKIRNVRVHQHVLKRDLSFLPHPPRFGEQPKIVEVDTLGRHFKLLLRPHTKPFHPRSHVHYSTTGAKVPIDVYQFHHGHVIGSEDASHVIAHITSDGILTAVIMADNDWYYIEPSSRHFKESHDFHMISYRGSDLKFNMTGKPDERFCGVHHDNDRHDHTGHHHRNDYSDFEFSKSRSDDPPAVPGGGGRRLKRQSGTIEASTVCPVNLVATTSFFQHFGASNVDHTTNFLLVVLLQIDSIYRSTDWSIPGAAGSASPGVRGLQVAEITVFDSTDNSPNYNSVGPWSSDDLLREFALNNWNDFCLAHLFTAQPFSDSSRLGVAYTAFANSLRAGGICSRHTTYQDQPFSGNVGISTYRSSDRFLILAEALVVTAHEFGHSWGSSHDPDTSECSPPFGTNAGKFLMYAYAQDGQSRNNMIFSSCSRQAISLVLNTHEDACFEAPSTDRCGDFIINEGEDCDPGPTRVLQDGDSCCNADCTFKTDVNGTEYTCSDANHDCCFNCRPSSVGEICREEEEGNINCFANRTCNGGISCPSDPDYVAEGTPCGVMGVCMTSPVDSSETTCSNFCELSNLTTCFCTGDSECLLCCMQMNDTCMPFGDQGLPLPVGRFCDGGTCDGAGVCVPSNPDLSTYLFELLTDFSTAAFARFLQENIVGVVLFFSLILWIPTSVAVHIFDVYLEKRNEQKKQEREAEKERKKKRKKKAKDGSDMTSPLIGSRDDVDSPPPQPFTIKEGMSPEFDTINTHLELRAGVTGLATDV